MAVVVKVVVLVVVFVVVVEVLVEVVVLDVPSVRRVGTVREVVVEDTDVVDVEPIKEITNNIHNFYLFSNG